MTLDVVVISSGAIVVVDGSVASPIGRVVVVLSLVSVDWQALATTITARSDINSLAVTEVS